jgi:hypothetical protein
MRKFEPTPSYRVLRLDPTAREWLEAARGQTVDPPDAIRALLAGRSRVEVGPGEAERALQWAAQLAGWREDARPPLFVYAPGELVAAG